jgi:very-short-patch-repair endonuclease
LSEIPKFLQDTSIFSPLPASNTPPFVEDGAGSSRLYERALSARRNPTRAERKLWGAIGALGVNRWFKRQRVFGRYYVDLYLPVGKAVVELDGSHHALDPIQAAYDARRTEYIESLGLRVFRFTNAQVMSDARGVVLGILAELHLSTTRERKDNPYAAPPIVTKRTY